MKFLPSRQKQKSGRPPVMVADLDALLTEKVSFRLLGRDHTIDPLSVEQFARFSQAYFDLLKLSEKESVSPDEMVEAYARLCGTICDSITQDDVRKMSQQQAAGLFQIMVDLHTGRLFGDQKKTLQKVETLLSMNLGR